MNMQKARPAILGAAVVYLLYLAYGLFDGRNDPETSMSPVVRYAFIALFALAAIALAIYAYRLWATARKQESEGKKEETSDEDSIKS